MKKFTVLFGLMIAFTAMAHATSIPPAVTTFFDTIMDIIIEKGILLGGVGIIIVGAILGFTNKSWSPFVYSIVGVIFMVIAKPFIISMISWSNNQTF